VNNPVTYSCQAASINFRAKQSKDEYGILYGSQNCGFA